MKTSQTTSETKKASAATIAVSKKLAKAGLKPTAEAIQKVDPATKAAAAALTTDRTAQLPVAEPTPAKKTAAKKAPAVVDPFAAFNSLTENEKAVLHYLCFELQDWRTDEPDYSCVGGSDISKAFGWDKKITGGVVSSMVQKGIVTTETDFPDILYPSWENIPADFGTTEPDLKPFKGKKAIKSAPTAAPAVAGAKVEEASTVDVSTKTYKPYERFGLHGVNKPIEEYKTGDLVGFDLKGKREVGTFLHLHINNHSPKGYIVIAFMKGDKKVYIERVPSKVYPVAKPEPVVEKAAPATEPIINPVLKGKAAPSTKKKSAKK